MKRPVRFELEPVAPFRLDLSVWALRRRPGNRVDRWDGTTYRRVVPLGASTADVAVVQVGPAERPVLRVAVTTEAPFAPRAVRAATSAVLRPMLGLDIDLEPFYRLARRDPHLRVLAERFRGLKPPRFPSLFESLANAIACQQLTLTVGIELIGRLVDAYGAPGPGDGQTTPHAFPDPEALAVLPPDSLRPLGFSRQKSSALVDIAHRVARGALRTEDITGLDDDAAAAELQGIRGVGRWSAEYVLLRGLGRLRIFPRDDVGARNTLQRRLGISGPLGPAEVHHITARWAPFSGCAYFHFLVAGLDEQGSISIDALPVTPAGPEP